MTAALTLDQGNAVSIDAKTFLSHNATAMWGHVFKVGEAVKDTTIKAIDAAARVVCDPGAMDNAIKVAIGSFSAMEIHRAAANVSFTALKGALTGVQNFIYATRLPTDIHYFVSGEGVKDHDLGRGWKVAGMGAILVVDVASTALWLADMGVMNLANIASKTGVSRLVPSLSLLDFTLGTLVAALAMFGMQEAGDVTAGRDVSGSTLKLTRMFADAALYAFMLTHVANPVALATLSLVSGTLGVTSFLYDQYHTPAKAV